jgi:hypothetical protein
MFAGAAGALVAGSAAAYMKRDTITGGISEGWTWASSHLEFVGCLARGEDLTKRLKSIIALSESGTRFGFANLYTTLGRAVEGKSQWASSVVGRDRTFCTVPKSEAREYWAPMVNDRATAETGAHMGMFAPRENPGYYGMSEAAKEKIVGWITECAWYEEAEEVESEVGASMDASFDEAEMVERPSRDVEMEEEELVSIEDIEKVADKDAAKEKDGKKPVGVEENQWA